MVPPKDKAFLDIKLVQECMDAHANRIGLAFAEWCAFNYMREFRAIDPLLPINEREYIQFWTDNDQGEYSTEQLFNKFIESITK